MPYLIDAMDTVTKDIEISRNSLYYLHQFDVDIYTSQQSKHYFFKCGTLKNAVPLSDQIFISNITTMLTRVIQETRKTTKRFYY